MSAVVLTPGQFSFEQTGVDRGHLCGAIVRLVTQVARAQKAEHRTRRDSRHVTSLLVEPIGVAACRDAVADKGGTRRAKRDQLMSIHRKVARVLAPETRFGSPIL